jgi:hypothetical protein
VNSISRRRFLKISGTTVSLAAASGYALKAADGKLGSAEGIFVTIRYRNGSPPLNSSKSSGFPNFGETFV